MMVHSITKSTLKQYQVPLKSWWTYSHSKQINTFNANIPEIITFLTKKFNEGASYSTLNTARAAIALISRDDISKDGLISRFLKGVYKQKPTAPRYSSTWDVTPVLEYLGKLHPLALLQHKEVGEKVATLLMLTTAQRLQTLALINIDNISISSTRMVIKVPEQIKTSKLNAYQPEITLNVFKEDLKICPVSVDTEYLNFTQPWRNDTNKNLFISSMKPHGIVTAQTLGHWIKSMLKKAGVDTDQFSAYSTRHAAVSTAYQRGVDIDTIKRTAVWSKRSQMFAKVYNKPIVSNNDKFADSILRK